MSEFILLATLFVIGAVGSFASGLLGLGGAIVLVPLLLYVPPLLGLGALDMKQVSGITVIVVLASSLAGLFVQSKNNLVSKSLMLIMGTTAVVFSFLGALYSKHTSSQALLGIFAAMAAFATIIMLIPSKETEEEVPPEGLIYNKPLAVVISLFLGFIGGMVGAPGAYIFTPLMIFFLKIPTKIAIGTTLGIAFVASISGALGKIVAGQVPFLMTAAVLLGAVPAAQLGARYTKKMSAPALRKALALVIGIATVRMLWDVIVHYFKL